MPRVLITGGAGFIGSHLASHCCSLGDVVRIVMRPESTRVTSQDVPIDRLRLSDAAALQDCFESFRPDIVFHLGVRSRRSNDPGLRDALDSVREDLVDLLTLLSVAACASHRPGAFIRTGSLAEYGNGPTPFDEAQRESPVNAYAAALVAGTHYLSMAKPRLPFRAVTARLALTYGARQSDDFLVPSLIRSCVESQPLRLRRPHDRRDLIYIDDVVDALRRLPDVESTPDIVNISTGSAPTVLDIASMVVEATGADPSLITFGTETSADAGIVNFCGSPDRARRMLGWQATTPLGTGLRRTAAWYRGLTESMRGQLQ